MKIEGLGMTDMSTTMNRMQVGEDQSFEELLQKAYTDGDKEKLKEACKSFEGVLMQMMYRQMKKTVPKSDFMPESYGMEIFEEMRDDAIIDQAKERGVGLADVLYRQLSLNMDNIYTVNHEKEE